MRYLFRLMVIGVVGMVFAGSAAPAAADAETWTGGSSFDNDWTSNGNWANVGGAAAGDDLFFPSVASRKSNNNDFANGTGFNSINITGSGYTLGGNDVTIGAGGVVVDIPSGTAPSINLGLEIPTGASRTFTNNGSVQVNYDDPVDVNDGTLVVAGSGNHVFNLNILSQNLITGGAPGQLTKNGTGIATLNAFFQALNGGIQVNAGTLVANGTGNGVPVSLNGGTLHGTGTIGTIGALASGGTVNPGGNAAGRLISSGVLSGNSLTLSMNLNGLTAITQYDQLAVPTAGGFAFLSGHNLALSLGFVPPVGSQFTIITATNGATIDGQFLQGNTITAQGRTFSITYSPTSVVVTAVATMRTWDGGGANNNWMTKENWAGDLAPVAGDNLSFPNATAQPANHNNFPPGTAFGSISVSHSSALITGNAIVLNGNLAVDAAGTNGQFNVPITLGADLTIGKNNASGVFTLGGTIAINGRSLGLNQNISTTMVLNGVISGSGSLTKTGAGVLRLAGANTYTGTTTVSTGTLAVRNSGALGATGTGNGTTIAANGSLIMEQDAATSEAITFGGAASAILTSGCDPQCSMNGPITLTGLFAVTVAVNETLVVGGNLAETGGPRGLSKSGPGVLTLAGTNTFTGPSVVFDGTLLVSGSIVSQIAGGPGIIGGTGTLSDIAANFQGTISPGASAGTLTAASVVGNANRTYHFEIGGTTQGSDYDRLAVTGSIALSGAQITGALVNGFTPTAGQQFTVITAASVTGQFAQGTTVTFSGQQFTITYNATSVVLTAVASTFTWDGGGGNNKWTTGDNWVGDVAPTAGDNLIFPAGAAQLSNNNDFPGGTIFNSIQILAAGYSLSGSEVVLLNGITAAPTGFVGLFVPIRLDGPQTFLVSSGTLAFGSSIALDSHRLTLNTATGALLNLNGPVNGDGGLTKEGTGSVLLLAASNTYTGTTLINQGTVEGGTAGASGPGNETIVASGATLKVTDGTYNESLVLNGTGVAGSSGALLAIGNVILSGPMTLSGATSISVSSANLTLTLSGAIGQSGGGQDLTKTGPGTLILTGTNTYTGITFVEAGTLLVSGILASTVNGGSGVLGGSGSVGGLGSGFVGTIAPGSSAATLGFDDQFNVSPSATVAIELGGTGPGIDHDQIAVDGQALLNGATLSLSLINNFVPVNGNSFTIVTATGGLSGQFVQGTSITAGGHQFSITYNANSVVLTKITPAPDLRLVKSHTGGNFVQGQTGRTFTLTIDNAGDAPTSGTVTVTESIPAGLTPTSISGTGWSCTQPAGPCTRSDALSAATAFPAITVTVNVSLTAPASVQNSAGVAGTGDNNAANNTGTDTVTVNPAPFDLTITKTHTGSFTQGDLGRTYTVTVSNAGPGPTNGNTVTVTETPPAGLIVTAMSGTGWTCDLATCTRAGVLANGASYPAITVTVTIADTAPALLTNVASVSTTGESNSANNTATDPTTIIAGPNPADVDCDLLVTPLDALAILHVIAGITIEPLPFGTCDPDVNGDGDVDLLDVIAVLEEIAS